MEEFTINIYPEDDSRSYVKLVDNARHFEKHYRMFRRGEITQKHRDFFFDLDNGRIWGVFSHGRRVILTAGSSRKSSTSA